MFFTFTIRYEVPDRKHLEGVMHSMYANAKEELSTKVHSLDFAALTCDTWTSKSNDGFIAVSVHGTNNDWELKEYILAVENIKVITYFAH